MLTLTHSGGDWGQEQVPHQRCQRAEGSRGELLPLCPAQRQQPTLPHHARAHHEGAQHEARGDPLHGGGGELDLTIPMHAITAACLQFPVHAFLLRNKVTCDPLIDTCRFLARGK